MIELTINKESYKIADRVEDISLSAYLGFLKYHQMIIKSDNDIQNKIDNEGYTPTNDDSINRMINMVKAISSFLEVPEDMVFNIPIGQVDDYFSLLKTEPKAGGSKMKLIYTFILSVINQYEPPIEENDYVFTHVCDQGIEREFTVKGFHRKNGDDLLISETIEIMEIQRLSKIHSSKENVNAEYTEKITMLSVLCKEKDEVWPATQSEIDDMIDRKKKIFKNVKAKVVIDLGFFLNNIFKR